MMMDEDELSGSYRIPGEKSLGIDSSVDVSDVDAEIEEELTKMKRLFGRIVGLELVIRELAELSKDFITREDLESSLDAVREDGITETENLVDKRVSEKIPRWVKVQLKEQQDAIHKLELLSKDFIQEKDLEKFRNSIRDEDLKVMKDELRDSISPEISQMDSKIDELGEIVNLIKIDERISELSSSVDDLSRGIPREVESRIENLRDVIASLKKGELILNSIFSELKKSDKEQKMMLEDYSSRMKEIEKRMEGMGRDVGILSARRGGMSLDELKDEQENLQLIINTVEGGYDSGLISEEDYQKSIGENKQKLEEIEARIREISQIKEIHDRIDGIQKSVNDIVELSTGFVREEMLQKVETGIMDLTRENTKGLQRQVDESIDNLQDMLEERTMEQKERLDAASSSFDEMKSKIAQLSKSLMRLEARTEKKDLEQMEVEREEVLRRLEVLKQDLEEGNISQDDYERITEETEQKLGEVESRIEEMERDMEMLSRIDELSQSVNQLADMSKSLAQNKELQELENRIIDITRENAEGLQQQVNESIENLGDMLEEKTGEQHDLISEQKERLDDVSSSFDEMKSKIAQLSQSVVQLDELSQSVDQLADMSKSLAQNKELQELENRIVDITRENAEGLQQQVNESIENLGDMIKSGNQARKEIRKELNKLKKEVTERLQSMGNDMNDISARYDKINEALDRLLSREEPKSLEELIQEREDILAMLNTSGDNIKEG